MELTVQVTDSRDENGNIDTTVDALSRAAEPLVGNAELLGIPEMDAGLITDLDINVEVRESRRATPDNPVLSLPA